MKRWKVSWEETRVFNCSAEVEAETEAEAIELAGADCADDECESHVEDSYSFRADLIGEVGVTCDPVEPDPNQLSLLPGEL